MQLNINEPNVNINHILFIYFVDAIIAVIPFHSNYSALIRIITIKLDVFKCQKNHEANNEYDIIHIIIRQLSVCPVYNYVQTNSLVCKSFS